MIVVAGVSGPEDAAAVKGYGVTDLEGYHRDRSVVHGPPSGVRLR